VTLWSVLCYIVQSTVNNVHCKAHCVTLYRAKLIVYTIKRTVLHCTGHSFSVNCKVYCVSLYRAQLLVYIVLCVPCHCTLYNWCAMCMVPLKWSTLPRLFQEESIALSCCVWQFCFDRFTCSISTVIYIYIFIFREGLKNMKSHFIFSFWVNPPLPFRGLFLRA